MLEKSCQWWIIWYILFFCHGSAEGQLQWVVKEKVTSYGQNLILLCPVENCCSEPAGWNVGIKAIILDVKTFSNDPKVKYHGTYNKDGFGVVIRNLSEADLNVTYRCVYGFDQSTPKYLLHDDVFRESQLQWVVKEKVTAYGQNLTLLSPVENCCSEPAGWSVGTKSIMFDVKTFSNDPKVKYHGTYNKDGFGVVIRSLSEADLDVTYRCVYGFDQSTPKYLLHGDVFRENVPDKDEEIATAAIVVPIVVIMVGFIIGIMAYCVYRSRIKKKRQKQKCTDKEKEAFHRSDIQIENKQGTDKEKEAFHRSDIQIENKQGTDKKKQALYRSDIQIENQQGTDKKREALYRSDIQIENREGTDKEKEALYRSDIQIENQQGNKKKRQKQKGNKKKRQKQKGTDKETEVLYPSDIQMENQQDKTNSLSKEENNFFRLYLLCQKIATQAVRQFFDSKVPGHTLEAFLKQHKPYLTSHRSVDRCTKDQEAKLFPDGQAVDVSTDFDFPLLYKLIRNLLTSLSDPTCGWGNPPSHGHVNETDDIEIVRKFRNMLSHTTEFAICDTDFSNHWTDLSQVIGRLSRGSLSTDVESMRMKKFDKCTENEMEELMRKDLKEIRKEFMELRQDVTGCKAYIADHRQEIHNINTRHIPLNIQTKEALDDLDLKDMMSCGRFGCIDGIVTDRVNEIDRQPEDQARLMTLPGDQGMRWAIGMDVPS